MIIYILETRKLNNKWFIRGQQFLYDSEHYGIVICESCGTKNKTQNMKMYRIFINDVAYDIPEEMITILEGDVVIDGEKTEYQRWVDKRCKDIAAPLTGGKTDVVLQAQKFLGINIRGRAHRVEVDQERLQLLKGVQEGYYDNTSE